MTRLTCLTIVAALGLGSAAIGQASLDPVDAIRLAEAFRLARAVQASGWPGWDATPFPVLLVTPEQEFLTGHPRTPAGFTAAGHSTVLQTEIWSRPRQFAANLLATFPAFGPPSVVVVGRAEATSKTSTTWVLTLLHEHFHQYQSSDPQYASAVDQLGLSDGDQTGMWMLNYPFPYRSPQVADRFSSVSQDLGRAIERSSAADRRQFWQTYAGFLDGLQERDRRYFRFQVWQEGVARYAELRVAEAAARMYTPSREFQGLPDFQPFSTAAGVMRAAILNELAHPDVAKQQRVSFYAFGAGLALLLDQDGEAWKSNYLTDKFDVVPRG